MTPFAGFTPYVSYAEGYRAPSITETLVAGAHATGGGPVMFNCPAGGGGLFCFLPNPNLRPEVGKNKEIGINLKYDNIFTAGDIIPRQDQCVPQRHRRLHRVERLDPDDGLHDHSQARALAARDPLGMFSQFYQYQNIDKAHIQGFEAETMYDAGNWFLGISGQLQRGYNDVTGEGLANIQPQQDRHHRPASASSTAS